MMKPNRPNLKTRVLKESKSKEQEGIDGWTGVKSDLGVKVQA
jgi:hypothetical protein